VAAGQDSREDAVHHILLADDPLGHLGAETLDGTDEALQLLHVVLGDALGCGHRLRLPG
jgi:hypothetical protein